MALKRRGKCSYGDAQADIRAELIRYSELNGYPASHFADAACKCGGRTFRLFIDEGVGVAVRECSGCNERHPLGDGDEYLAEASLEECECPCGSSAFEITAGVALYADSEDIRWFYVGCRCPSCGLTACYGDWKNEFTGYQTFLDRV
jgi:hypothetical protein